MARRGIRVDLDWYGHELLAIVEKEGDTALFAAGQVIEEEAQRRAPRRRGQLAGSGYVATRSKTTYIRRRFWRKEKRAPEGGAVIAFSAPHAHLIEGGRRKAGAIRPKRRKALHFDGQFRARARYNRQGAQPFLGPAVEASKDTLTERLADVLRQKLEQGMPR